MLQKDEDGISNESSGETPVEHMAATATPSLSPASLINSGDDSSRNSTDNTPEHSASSDTDENNGYCVGTRVYALYDATYFPAQIVKYVCI